MYFSIIHQLTVCRLILPLPVSVVGSLIVTMVFHPVVNLVHNRKKRPRALYTIYYQLPTEEARLRFTEMWLTEMRNQSQKRVKIYQSQKPIGLLQSDLKTDKNRQNGRNKVKTSRRCFVIPVLFTSYDFLM